MANAYSGGGGGASPRVPTPKKKKVTPKPPPGGGASGAPRVRAQTAAYTAARKNGLTDRQAKVVATGAANVADKYNLKPKGQKRFGVQAAKNIAAGGSVGREYRRTIVQADRTETTKAEARGAKRVLKRAAPAPKAASATPHHHRRKPSMNKSQAAPSPRSRNNP